MIHQNPLCKLIAVVDTDVSCEKEVAKLDHVSYHASLKGYLESDIKADVLCIATPNSLHTEQALIAIEAGHHVVIEKPMGLSRTQCEAVINKAKQHGKQIFCVMQNRYSPPSIWLKKIVDENILGNIFLVQVNCYWNRDERYYKSGSWHGKHDLDGGTLFTQFSHFIDLIYWVFGNIDHIDASFYNFNHQNLTDFEDSGMVKFNLQKGGVGTLNYSTSVWDKNLESSITLIAEHGTIKIGGQYMDQILHCHIKNYELPQLPPTNPPNDYGSFKGSAANHQYVIENVVNVLSGRAGITTTASDGLMVVDIIERIYALKTR